jgi:hypothetical protein
MKYFSNWVIYSFAFILILASPIIAGYVSISPDSITAKIINTADISKDVMYIVYVIVFSVVVLFHIRSFKMR